ncbi:MAG: hypothetical protein Q9162_002077 [Coniocarpon cinnabarinum]
MSDNNSPQKFHCERALAPEDQQPSYWPDYCVWKWQYIELESGEQRPVYLFLNETVVSEDDPPIELFGAGVPHDTASKRAQAWLYRPENFIRSPDTIERLKKAVKQNEERMKVALRNLESTMHAKIKEACIKFVTSSILRASSELQLTELPRCISNDKVEVACHEGEGFDAGRLPRHFEGTGVHSTEVDRVKGRRSD